MSNSYICVNIRISWIDLGFYCIAIYCQLNQTFVRFSVPLLKHKHWNFYSNCNSCECLSVYQLMLKLFSIFPLLSHRLFLILNILNTEQAHHHLHHCLIHSYIDELVFIILFTLWNEIGQMHTLAMMSLSFCLCYFISFTSIYNQWNCVFIFTTIQFSSVQFSSVRSDNPFYVFTNKIALTAFILIDQINKKHHFELI